MSILKGETYKKGIIYSSLFNVGGKSIAFIQQWLIGFYFGTHSDTDVFFFTYNIILFLSYFFLNYTTSVLIPEGIKIRNQVSDNDSKRFLNTYILLYCIIGLTLSVLSLFGTEKIFAAISSFPSQIISDNITLIRWCIPLIFLNIVVSIMTEILAAYKYFTAPNLVTFINYTIGVIFITLFHDSLGINAIAIGLLIGYIINLIVVIVFMKKALNWSFFSKPITNTKQILSCSIYSQIGYIIYLIALYVPQNIFSQMPPGHLSAINFADKLLSIPSIFLVAQITNVMGIKINDLVSQKLYSELSHLTIKLIVGVSTGLLSATIIISLISGPLVSFLFAWGNYGPDSISITTKILASMIFYLPFSFMFGIYMKFFNAFKKQNIFFYLQLFTQGITLILYFYIIPQFGLYSYPLCRIVPYILSTLIAGFALKSIYKDTDIKKITYFHLLISFITIVFLLYND